MKTVSQDFFYRHKWLLIAMIVWVAIVFLLKVTWLALIPVPVALVAGWLNSKKAVKK